MEVDEAGEGVSKDPATALAVMASPGTAGSSTLSLHPLVIMNISEHWTRTKVQNGSPMRVYGAIIGKQKGREIEIMNSFELDYLVCEGKTVIDREYYNIKELQFKQVFSDMDFLGWYSTGDQPTEEDIYIQKQILEIHESPLLLLLNPGARHSDIPLTAYESIMDIVGGEARMQFVKLSYSLATEEAERIGLDHVARISTANEESQSKVAENLMVQHSAIKMLASRINLIMEYVNAVEAGELPFNHEILREAKAMTDRLPVLVSSEKFDPEFYTQYNDVALMTLMGTVHSGCNDIVTFINKFNMLYQRMGASSGRRIRGMYF